LTSPTVSKRGDFIKRLTAWIELLFLVGLFVLWQILHWSFVRSAEFCIVGGILVFSALNVYSAMRLAWSGPAMVSRLSRLAAVVLYMVMRYALHYGFWRSVGVWAVPWIVAPWIVSHSRRRALSAGPVGM